MCSHWGRHLDWVKREYGCIPCLPERLRQAAFDVLPQSLRHLIGVHNIHPLETIPRLPPLRALAPNTKAPHEFNRAFEREDRRWRIWQFIARQEKKEARRALVCEALGMHPQTLLLDLAHLVETKALRIVRVEGRAKVYRCTERAYCKQK